MTRLLKTLLLWLLMAALPLQGLAAVVKSACAPAEHATMIAANADAGHRHAAGTAHHHHDGAEASAHGAAHDTVKAAKAEAPAHKHASCSACATCCVGALAPPTPSLTTPDHAGSELVVLSPPALAVAHLTAGQERPPKPVSA
ncbi:hypothetical protein [Noviherbaspirillum humi]|uniref:hypothetical protein n=1 Tax=Noviherbaspirillum humi TaxID=1688639 RepID=UPI000B78CC9C|nr:hypothetical protein [Noviherbaspirillum humi]